MMFLWENKILNEFLHFRRVHCKGMSEITPTNAQLWIDCFGRFGMNPNQTLRWFFLFFSLVHPSIKFQKIRPPTPAPLFFSSSFFFSSFVFFFFFLFFHYCCSFFFIIFFSYYCYYYLFISFDCTINFFSYHFFFIFVITLVFFSSLVFLFSSIVTIFSSFSFFFVFVLPLQAFSFFSSHHCTCCHFLLHHH